MRQDERLLLFPHRTPPLADSPVGCEYPTLAAQPLTQAEMVRHSELTNRAVFGLVQACLEAEVPPGLVANVLLYDWLRASTINANMPEPFFQTLERHWETVMERVAACVDTLVHRTRPWVAPSGVAPRDVHHSCGRGGLWTSVTFPTSSRAGACLALVAAPDPNAMGMTHARFFLGVSPES